MSEVEERPPVTTATAQDPTWRDRLIWQAVSMVGVLATLLVARQFRPFFWYVDDKRNQYVTVFADIGRRLLAGEFPAIDPNLGPSGNYSLDTQYAIYDPLHLLVAVCVSKVHNLATAGFLLGAVFLLIMAWGTTALAQRLGLRGPYAALVGLGSATGGYLFFFLASNWIPGAIGMAFVPWLWWSLLGEGVRVRRLPLVALFSYLIIASGWPSTWMVFVGLTVGFAVEALVRRTDEIRAWAMPVVWRALAALAGALIGVIGIIPLQHAASWTIRSQLIENDNKFIVNFADVLNFAMPYLHGDIVMFSGSISTMYPIFFFGWFLLPLMCLMRWGRVRWRDTGVPTAVVGLVLLTLATQLPSTLGPIRDQFRQLAGLQFFALVLVGVIAWRAGLTVSRARLLTLAGAWAAMTLLAWSRTPTEQGVFVGALVAAVALAVVVLAWARLSWTGVAAAGAVGTLVLVPLAVALTVNIDAQPPDPHLTPGPLALKATDAPTFVLYPIARPPAWKSWQREGVGRAFAHLSAQTRIMPGYSSVSQQYWRNEFLIGRAQGETRPGVVRRLFSVEPTTGRQWVDLLGLRTIVLNRNFTKAWHKEHPAGWTPVRQSRSFVVYQRPAVPGVTGRITYAAPGVTVRALSVTNASQSYHVTAPSGGLLVFRDVYWPGYYGTLGGKPITVRALHRSLVEVRLPAGTDAELEVHYRPVPYRDVAGLSVLALLSLGTAVGGPLLLRRRLDRRSAAEA